jgi:hypothetical protein
MAPESTNAVVVGMVVGHEVTHGHVPVGGPLDAAGTEKAIGIAVNQQRQHGMRRVLGIAAPLLVDGESRKGQAFHRADDEVDQVVLRHPVAQVRRQKQGSVPVNILEAMCHNCLFDCLGMVSFNHSQNCLKKKSDRLLITILRLF